jgi:hypothetical protein
MTAGVGRRWFTITAWEDLDSMQAAMRENPPHQDAMRDFFRGEFASSVHTSVWVPHRIGVVWVRCPACGQVFDHDKAQGRCQCGQTTPERPDYW